MITRIVVLGTGTNVGKTWVCSALARAAAVPSLALKPIETGVSPTLAGDATLLAAAAAHSQPPLHAYPDPVTPWLAAERRGDAIDIHAIRDWVSHCEATHRTTSHVLLSIIETAGGVFSPLARAETNLTLARALDPALWLLVAPNTLGVLHQVSATLLAMQHLRRAADLLVLSAAYPDDPSTSTNASLLRRLHPDQPLLELGRDAAAAGHDLYDWICRRQPGAT